MKFFKFLLFVLLTYFFVNLFDTQQNTLPPLGKFLDPFQGFWQNAETEFSVPTQLTLKGLKAPVRIYFDNRLVPHIFAQNDADLYFAQGYVTAQLRLWQMEFQTHAAAGRLSEIVGKKAIQYDRMQRRLGLAFAAEKALSDIKNTEEYTLLQAYANGVNAYIKTLTYKTLPLEYKLLSYYPEEWTPLKTMLLLKSMANTLTGHANDIEHTNLLALLGKDNFDLLYPDFPENVEPVVPHNYHGNIFKQKDTTIIRIDSLYKENVYPKPDPFVGSNNWAVNGKKTTTGAPILCNDPHLKLTLPSIWFEVQLSTPTNNVYGVTLPGSPGVVIGFNDKIAWGMTNATNDVKDYFKIQFKNSSKDDYLYDNEWLKTNKRVEKIKVKGAQDYIDTVVYTHLGPIVFADDMAKDEATKNLALRWTIFEPSNELRSILLLNKAQNYEDYLNAIKTFACPGQNFVFASQNNDIAIWHQGLFPKKMIKGQGKFIADGTKSLNNWSGFIPHEENPHLLNPSSNFVSSANQHPTDSTYTYYYNGVFEHFRNRRINQILGDTLKKIDLEEMLLLQNDNFNLKAAEILPYLLQFVKKEYLTDIVAKQVYQELKGWDFYNEANSLAATCFEIFWQQTNKNLWDELNDSQKAIVYPQDFYVSNFIKKYPEHILIDIKKTGKKETLADIVAISFEQTVQEIKQHLKAQKSLFWSDFRHTKLEHLALLPVFSIDNVKTGGVANAVNAMTSTNGPSWRMVVQLSQPIKAYGVYPGGQSGNPGSYFYDNAVEQWANGKYYELLFIPSEAVVKNYKILKKLTLDPLY